MEHPTVRRSLLHELQQILVQALEDEVEFLLLAGNVVEANDVGALVEANEDLGEVS